MLFKEYKVPRPTLVGWAKRWEVDPNWLPGNFDRYAMVKNIDLCYNEVLILLKYFYMVNDLIMRIFQISIIVIQYLSIKIIKSWTNSFLEYFLRYYY